MSAADSPGRPQADGGVVGPLDGLRVVELATWMAAPSAGAALADMGAEVVKVEPLSGDPVRGMTRPARPADGRPETDAGFHVDNRGKRSVAVAVDRPEGADLVRRMVAGADVFLCNLLPHRQQRYGLDPPTLFASNPSLVHATLTGYGLTGADSQRPGFDVTAYFGRTGLLDAMTDPGAIPPPPRAAQGDHTAGLALVAGVLAALRVVERTGEGQVVDVSLMATAAWTVATELAPIVIDGRPPTRRERTNLIAPLANRFRCGDDRWFIINMPEPRWWAPFCATIGLPELVDDERFATVRSRFDNVRALTAILDAQFARRTLAEWGEILDAAGMIWGPVANYVEFARDPQPHAAGVFPTFTSGEHTFPTVAVPFRIGGADIRPRGGAPLLGEHSEDELHRIGIDAATFGQLVESGVIGVPRGSDG